MTRILIVDDEENVRFMLGKYLKTKGYEVCEASDGNVALKLLCDQTVDLVVTDILMPNREGIEMIQEIRLNWPEIKIIAMSGGGRVKNTEFLRAAEKFGADMVMKKPFAMTEFKSAVDRLLDAELWQGG